MDDRAGLQAAAASASATQSWIVFVLAGERLALPMASVEAVAVPPPLAPLPHATPAVLGVGNLAGQIVPILDFAGLLGRQRDAGKYDGSGEIIRLRIPGGSVGLWVDRVERLLRIDRAGEGWQDADDMTLIDPTRLVVAALAPPTLASSVAAPLGEVADRVLPAATAVIAEPFIVVEVAGQRVALRRETVAELVEAVPWMRMPRAPAGLSGVGVLRGTALPVLSLAVLSGLAEPASPGGFAVIELLGYRALLAVDRIVGLRFGRQPDVLADPAQPEAATEPGEAIDLAAAISEEVREIVIAFSQDGDVARRADSTMPNQAAGYLAFTVAEQDFALPIGCVDRVVEAQPLIELPRPANDDLGLDPIVGAIELRGQIVPVAALRSRLGLTGVRNEAIGPAPSAYVILRGDAGLGAIGVDRIRGVAALRPGDIAAPPAEHELIEGVAPGDGGLLRIIAPARLWGGG
ncbi:MAG TPA: chemotaxis protein CheW [Stellaceae bacterium]|jgi:chemotaxis signal transduction protein|nr:chemotaxis protein CheW [Stellaceae bacterium]